MYVFMYVSFLIFHFISVLRKTSLKNQTCFEFFLFEGKIWLNSSLKQQAKIQNKNAKSVSVKFLGQVLACPSEAYDKMS